MGWSVSRHSEPGRKLIHFESRLCGFRGALKRRARLNQVSCFAERLRRVAFTLMQAKRALIREYPQRASEGRQRRTSRSRSSGGASSRLSQSYGISARSRNNLDHSFPHAIRRIATRHSELRAGVRVSLSGRTAEIRPGDPNASLKAPKYLKSHHSGYVGVHPADPGANSNSWLDSPRWTLPDFLT
jgi:hypothetical protein